MSAEDSSARTGCSADGKRVTDRGHSTGRRAGHGNRPPCAAKNCELPSRPDSRYCSDGCGVLTAEMELSEALRHSLEEKGGNERGRRLLEIKEAKLRKIEVGGWWWCGGPSCQEVWLGPVATRLRSFGCCFCLGGRLMLFLRDTLFIPCCMTGWLICPAVASSTRGGFSRGYEGRRTKWKNSSMGGEGWGRNSERKT